MSITIEQFRIGAAEAESKFGRPAETASFSPEDYAEITNGLPVPADGGFVLDGISLTNSGDRGQSGTVIFGLSYRYTAS